MKNNNKALVLTLAERCKNILSGNWQGQLHTINGDAKGSGEIHSSKIKYLFRRGKPYVWIRENDMHNVNAILDERASLSVANIMPGALMSFLKSIKKLPARVALLGDIVPLEDEKAKLAFESLSNTILSEQNAISQASYSVSGILSSSSITCGSRSEHLQEVLEQSTTYVAYKFNIRACTYIDGSGCKHEMEQNDIEIPERDLLTPFSEKLIDGINQSQARRRALMLFCFVFLNTNARDACLVSIDHKGFDILGKVLGEINKDGLSEYKWKEFRFTFKEEAHDIETFCRYLVEMEEEALKNVSSYSGLGLV